MASLGHNEFPIQYEINKLPRWNNECEGMHAMYTWKSHLKRLAYNIFLSQPFFKVLFNICATSGGNAGGGWNKQKRLN